jgi:hypothetical protein
MALDNRIELTPRQDYWKRHTHTITPISRQDHLVQAPVIDGCAAGGLSPRRGSCVECAYVDAGRDIRRIPTAKSSDTGILNGYGSEGIHTGMSGRRPDVSAA